MNRFLTTEDLNDYGYCYHRKKASKPYEETMLSLVEGDEEKLKVSLHGEPYDNYYVYMVDQITLPDHNWIRYDFMIEYYLKEPSLGIYYGCRCVAEWESNIFFAEKLVDEHWDAAKQEVIRVLNATFPGRDFSKEFQVADNANDYTYWAFWLRLNPREDIREVAVRVLKLIRNVYVRHIGLKRIITPSDGFFVDPPATKTRFTRWNYTNLISRLAPIVRADEKTISDILEKFIRISEEKEWISADPILECGYRFRSCLGYTQSSGCAFMIEGFMQYLNDKVGRAKGSELSVPWNAWVSLILSSEGEPWSPDAIKIKIQKRYSRDIRKDNMKDTLKELIGRIKNEIAFMIEEK